MKISLETMAVSNRRESDGSQECELLEIVVDTVGCADELEFFIVAREMFDDVTPDGFRIYENSFDNPFKFSTKKDVENFGKWLIGND